LASGNDTRDNSSFFFSSAGALLRNFKILFFLSFDVLVFVLKITFNSWELGVFEDVVSVLP